MKMATERQKKAIEKLVETRGNVSKAMKLAGYDDTTAKNPKNLTDSAAFRTLADHITDELLEKKHLELLNATTLDHMTFGLGPKNEEDKQKLIQFAKDKALYDGKEYVEVDYITDDDIKEMLSSVNCVVRRIAHRETGRDVYFWASDNMARDKALDKAYKLKGSYAAEKSVTLDVKADLKDLKEMDSLREKYEEELKKKILG